MRTQRVGAFVLEVDMGRGAQGLFKGIGAYQRCGTVIFVFVEHFFRNIYPCVFSVQLLHTALAGEDVCQVIDA